MSVPNISIGRPVIRMIYAWSTPDIPKYDGCVKIGQTEQNVDDRISQQASQTDIEKKTEWRSPALYEDGSGIFSDHDFHRYLMKLGIQRIGNTEFFKIDGETSKKYLQDFKENKGVIAQSGCLPYILRQEQSEAVSKAMAYAQNHVNGEFLWNCKPRFGKTLSAYDLCQKLGAAKVLIVTNRPAIANSWYEDYERFFGRESGYYFVSSTDALKNKKLCINREQFVDQTIKSSDAKCIEFVSLQDLKGSKYFGKSNGFDKLRHIADLVWDVLIIDEAHEGVDTLKTDAAFDMIKRNFTLHLSGTPFKAIANDKFADDQIFNWTYAQEQAAKRDWTDPDLSNPYLNLPKLNMFTYRMSDMVLSEIRKGIEIDGETESFCFDLNEFFATDGNGRFIHDDAVDKFLDALTTCNKYPFSTDELRNELKHTFWLLNRVDSAKALSRKLKEHPVFQEYEIVLAAGDGRSDDDDESVQKSFDRVKAAIKYAGVNGKTITLSVGQLTTGVTIPEWSAVLMLSSMKSPALYMQAAFRSQNPCFYDIGNGQGKRKTNAYVFDFDPARTLDIFDRFANDLNSLTSEGRGNTETRRENIKELLNFFPVIGEDDDGEMIELDAEHVMSIPRKLHAQEVVRCGFMSNFLFQNVAGIFSAPEAVTKIIEQFDKVSNTKSGSNLSSDAQTVQVDDNGDVIISEVKIAADVEDIFGSKIYDDDIPVANIVNTVSSICDDSVDDVAVQKAVDAVVKKIADVVLAPVKEHYRSGPVCLTKSDENRLNRDIRVDTQSMVGKVVLAFRGDVAKAKADRDELLEICDTDDEREYVLSEYQEQCQRLESELNQTITDRTQELMVQMQHDAVQTVQKSAAEKEKKVIEDDVRDHLRGFARTIPSFLMAYGTEDTRLETFEKTIPEDVFQEVTSITVDDFRFLRDGGSYEDAETGEIREFSGGLFEPVVFNDSVREFMRLRRALSNYFDENQNEDIFDYIPPQKTNQIFTPKAVVKHMVDLLEQENPGCFDNPDFTFMDMYMKSGLFITEIVRRLYNSNGLKAVYPDDKERLRHIFAKQVYGLAPTEIIYQIATNFILGFTDDVSFEHNFRCMDALEYAKTGSLDEKLSELYS